MKTNRDSPDNSVFWRLLWQLQLPPKVLNFLWRASTNSLPTRFHLSTKHVPIAATCPFCLAAPEMTLHVQVGCSFAQSFWSKVPINVVVPDAMLFSSWFEAGLASWNTVEALEAGMICSSVWTHRNDLVWNSKRPDASEVVINVKLNYVEWFNAQKHNVTDASLNWPTALPVEHWTTPDFPFVKVNVDGALFFNQGRYGLGLIARSAAGMVLEARILSREGTLQPHIVEAIGIKEALSWSKANGWSHVVVESDCLRVINDLQKLKSMASPYGHILYNCRTLVAEFDVVSFNFAKRSANKVVHALA
ncbi:hypothetical protein CsatB_024301 [Cannabis sativa]